jgi:hypothetical protein
MSISSTYFYDSLLIWDINFESFFLIDEENSKNEDEAINEFKNFQKNNPTYKLTDWDAGRTTIFNQACRFNRIAFLDFIINEAIKHKVVAMANNRKDEFWKTLLGYCFTLGTSENLRLKNIDFVIRKAKAHDKFEKIKSYEIGWLLHIYQDHLSVLLYIVEKLLENGINVYIHSYNGTESLSQKKHIRFLFDSYFYNSEEENEKYRDIIPTSLTYQHLSKINHLMTKFFMAFTLSELFLHNVSVDKTERIHVELEEIFKNDYYEGILQKVVECKGLKSLEINFY